MWFNFYFSHQEIKLVYLKQLLDELPFLYEYINPNPNNPKSVVIEEIEETIWLENDGFLLNLNFFDFIENVEFNEYIVKITFKEFSLVEKTRKKVKI